MPFELSLETKLEVSDEQAHLLVLLQNLLDAGETSLANVKAVGEFQQAVGLLAGQAVASGRALHALCVVGRANQAPPTGRSMVENMINAYYIARDPGTRAHRFWTHRPIPHARVADAVFELLGVANERDEIHAQAAAAKQSLGADHWAGRTSIRARAEECGMLLVWKVYYQEASSFSHGDASTWNLLSSDDGKRIHFGPSSEGIERAIAPALCAAFGTLFLVAEVFGDATLAGKLKELGEALPPESKRLDLRAQFEAIRKRRL